MKRRGSIRLLAISAAVSLGLVVSPAMGAEQQAENFSLVVFPDTQYSSQSYPAAIDAQGKWVKENKDERNIAYALHAGDIVDDADEPGQWETAKNGMGWLEGNVPYILGVGNHDMDAMSNGEDPEKVRDTEAFNKNFPVSKFEDLPSFGGSYPEGKNDNSYHTFSAGGTDWLALSLKYVPTDKELDWANKVVADHPNHQVMIVSHSYQKGDQKTEDGKRIWSELASKHANISFVFSGHHVAAGMIEEEGEKGNTVYQIQADYQDPDKLDPNSFFRLMEFNPTDKTVSVETYSPYLNENKDDKDNEFVIENFEFMPAA